MSDHPASDRSKSLAHDLLLLKPHLQGCKDCYHYSYSSHYTTLMCTDTLVISPLVLLWETHRFTGHFYHVDMEAIVHYLACILKYMISYAS
jgi:hypothetical protein